MTEKLCHSEAGEVEPSEVSYRNLYDDYHSICKATNITKPVKGTVSLSIYLLDALMWLDFNATKLVTTFRIFIEVICPEARQLLKL